MRNTISPSFKEKPISANGQPLTGKKENGGVNHFQEAHQRANGPGANELNLSPSQRKGINRALDMQMGEVRRQLKAANTEAMRVERAQKEKVARLREAIRSRMELEWTQMFTMAQLRAEVGAAAPEGFEGRGEELGRPAPSLKEIISGIDTPSLEKSIRLRWEDGTTTGREYLLQCLQLELAIDEAWTNDLRKTLEGWKTLTDIRQALGETAVFLDWLQVRHPQKSEDGGNGAQGASEPVRFFELEGRGAQSLFAYWEQAPNETMLSAQRMAEFAAHWDGVEIRAEFERLHAANRLALGRMRYALALFAHQVGESMDKIDDYFERLTQANPLHTDLDEPEVEATKRQVMDEVRSIGKGIGEHLARQDRWMRQLDEMDDDYQSKLLEMELAPGANGRPVFPSLNQLQMAMEEFSIQYGIRLLVTLTRRHAERDKPMDLSAPGSRLLFVDHERSGVGYEFRAMDGKTGQFSRLNADDNHLLLGWMDRLEKELEMQSTLMQDGDAVEEKQGHVRQLQERLLELEQSKKTA